MVATNDLREYLSKEGVKYRKLGDNMTYVSHDGISWEFRDNYDGTLMVSVSGRLSPGKAMRAVFGDVTTAVVNIVVDDDGVGMATCGNCGRSVGEWFGYCPGCGARFIETRHSHR